MHGAASSPPTVEFRLGRVEFIAMMASMMALQALAIDAMLPALDEIAASLRVTDPNRRQLVIGLFLIASGVGSLFPGSLADRYGRRPVLFTCITVYICLSLACALVTSFDVLIGLRIVQGLFSSGMGVLAAAIVRDRFGGDRMASVLSLIAMVFLIVPILAPSVGQAVLLFASWRWIFVVLAVLGTVVGVWAWLRLPETLHPEFRQPIQLGVIAVNMKIALTTRASVGYMLGAGLVMAGLFGFLNSSQQLVAEHFGAGDYFPLIFGGMALTMALANLLNSRIVERFGARRVSHAALFAFIAASAVQVYFAFQPDETLWEFVPIMACNFCLIGFLGANFSSIAMQPFDRIAGAASSVQSFVRLLTGALVGTLIGQAYDGSAKPIAVSLLGLATLALLLVLYSENGRLFRRKTQPGHVTFGAAPRN